MGMKTTSARSRSRAVAAATAALATTAVLALAGSAAPVGAATAFGPQTPLAAGSHGTGQVRPYDDGVWGGYVAQGRFTSISGSWVEPQATCNTSNDLFAPWVGIDGYGSQTVEQAGVQTDCSSGRPVLSAWYEMYPAAPVYWKDAVSPGDTITSSVVTKSRGSYTITLSDTTKGWTEHTTQRLSAQNVSAEAVIESPTQSYPSFDELDFSNVTVNGQPFSSYDPQAITSGGYGPGELNGGDFSITPEDGGWGWASHATPSHQAARPGTIRY
ncbi:G1 family glutamic endopeptidase [Streptantibioticus parmotrematis]|uniref:G1 family glutamic endopeptidase n=1 Tax=Streptantibioticus parmotrematis TaxID=2873249 RepID=UPI00340515A0